MTHKRIYGLDVVRCLAIFLVLALHAVQSIHAIPVEIKRLFFAGWAGVDIFFVLSGFLIASQTFKEEKAEREPFKIRLNNFWVKRWFRTLPLYAVALGVYVFIKPLLGFEFKDQVWKYLIFIQNYLSPRDFTQSWSLCIEEQFYFIFPFIVFVFPQTIKKAWFWLLPIAVSICVRAYLFSVNQDLSVTNYAYIITFPTYNRMDGISLGVFLAFTQDHWRPYAAQFKNSLFALGFLGFCFCLYYFGPMPLGQKGVWCYFFLSVFSAFMVMAGNYIHVPKSLEKSIFWFATLSYGMYLWNNLIIKVMVKAMKDQHWSVTTIAFFIATIIISYITYKVVEMPFMKIRNRYLK